MTKTQKPKETQESKKHSFIPKYPLRSFWGIATFLAVALALTTLSLMIGQYFLYDKIIITIADYIYNGATPFTFGLIIITVVLSGLFFIYKAITAFKKLRK